MAREDLERYNALSIRLQRLWDEGRGETPEADAIREESDGPWYAMTDAERDEASRYSGDLDAGEPGPDEHPV